MGTIRIREGRPGDAAAIHAINHQGVPGVAPLSEREAADLRDRATSVRVAEVGGAVAGYVIVFSSDAEYDGEEFLWFRRRLASGDLPPFLYIDQVAVDGATRRAGVASALYDAVAGEARARGLAALTCEVNLRPENRASLRFHHRRGFVAIGELETRDGRRVSLLRHSLSS